MTNSTIILSFQMSHFPSVNETAPVTEMSRRFKVMKPHYILRSVKFSCPCLIKENFLTTPSHISIHGLDII